MMASIAKATHCNGHPSFAEVVTAVRALARRRWSLSGPYDSIGSGMLPRFIVGLEGEQVSSKRHFSGWITPYYAFTLYFTWGRTSGVFNGPQHFNAPALHGVTLEYRDQFSDPRSVFVGAEVEALWKSLNLKVQDCEMD